jgi:integral membrane sensor domain MASE1
VRVLVFFVAYLLCELLGGTVFFFPGNIVPFDAAAGLLAGAFLISGPLDWAGYTLAALIARLLYPHYGHLPALEIAATAGEAAQALVLLALLRLMKARMPQMGQARSLLRMTLAAGCAALVGAGTHLLLEVLRGANVPLMKMWFAWWGAETVGILIVAPLVLTWTAGADAEPTVPGKPKALFMETACFFASLIVGTALAFGWGPFRQFAPFASIVLPLLLWASMRLTARTLTAAMVLMGAMAGLGVSAGGASVWEHTFGPFGLLFHLQMFLGVSQVSILFFSALVRRRHAAEAHAKMLNESLEQRVKDRTAELEESRSRYRELTSIAPVGIFRMDADRQMIFANERLAGSRVPG